MGKILIVDDDPVIQKMLVDRITQEGYTVITANNGREGIELALKEKPDLTILDIVMPEMDGITMLKALRADPAGAEMQVMMLTSMEDSASISEALNNKVFKYMKKDALDVQEVIDNIHTVLNDSNKH